MVDRPASVCVGRVGKRYLRGRVRAVEQGAPERGGHLRSALLSLRAALLASLGFSLPLGCGGETSSDRPKQAAVTPCTDPADVGGGIERCAEGWPHRATVVTCESTVPRAGTIPAEGSGDHCDSDADCSRLSYGHCRPRRDGLPPAERLECRAGCVSDADCGIGKLSELAVPCSRALFGAATLAVPPLRV